MSLNFLFSKAVATSPMIKTAITASLLATTGILGVFKDTIRYMKAPAEAINLSPVPAIEADPYPSSFPRFSCEITS